MSGIVFRFLVFALFFAALGVGGFNCPVGIAEGWDLEIFDRDLHRCRRAEHVRTCTRDFHGHKKMRLCEWGGDW